MEIGGGALFDRGVELARLREAVHRSVSGDGNTIVLEGDAGAGKTALIQATVASARAKGCQVLHAHGMVLEQGYPFGIARQWFDSVIREADAPDRARLLEGRAGHAMAAIDPSVHPNESLVSVLDGLHWLMTALTDDGPLLAVVDDAQWADPDSLHFLAYLVPRMTLLPVTILVATRTGELRGSPLGVVTAASATHMHLDPLSAGAVEAMVVDVLGAHDSARFSAACHVCTGGNPFLVHALLDELRRTGTTPSDDAADRVLTLGPRAVATAVVGRLALLSADAPTVARALCVLGDGAARTELAATTGLPAGSVAAALDELERAGIVTGDDDPRFLHAITENAVNADMGRATRCELHRTAAAVLSALGAPVERLVAHVLAAGTTLADTDVEIVRQAADVALRRGAAATAVDFLRRAIVLCGNDRQRFALLRDAGVAEQLIDGPSSVEHLRAALALSIDAAERAGVGAALSRSLLFADEPVESASEALAATDAARSLGDADLVHRLEALQFAGARVEPRLDAVRERTLREFHERGLRSDGPGARALMAAITYHESRALAIGADEAARRARWALAEGHLVELDNGGADFMATVLVLLAADSAVAREVLEAGVARADETGDVFAYAGCTLFLCQDHLQRGELADAISAGEAALDASIEYGIAIGLPWGSGLVAAAHLATGDHDAAMTMLQRAHASADVPDSGVWHEFVHARARLLLATGNPGGALDAAIDAGRRFGQLDGRNPAFMPWRSLAAQCLLAIGDEDRARSLAVEEVELARAWGAPRALGRALRVSGLASGADGASALDESVVVLAGTSARLEHAESLVAMGAAIRRRGARAAARAPLAEGLAIARGCGAMALAAAAADELSAAGGRPGQTRTSGVEALTPSERRVAGLAASGMTNRAIAQQLFVTQKTVEFHLAQTFRKLGVARRTELGRFFPPS